MNILSFCGGAIVVVVTLLLIVISEWLKLMMDWSGDYVGISWFTIWRIERLRKQSKYREAKILQYGKEAVEFQERSERRKYERKQS